MGRGHHRHLRRHRYSCDGGVYLVTAATRDRTPVFVGHAAFAAAPCFAEPAVLGATRMLAWVLMPDHAHWLLQLENGETLPRTVSRLKCASARAVNRRAGRTGPVWARAYHDHSLRTEDSVLEAARYVCMNPVRAGLVRSARFYPFWDAVWL